MKPIINFDLHKVYPGLESASDLGRASIAERFGVDRIGRPILIGTFQVGRVIDFMVNIADGQTTVGLVIEWSKNISVSQLVTGD